MPPPDDDRQELEPLVGRIRRPWLATIASVLAALLAGGALTVELIDSDGDRVPDGARVIVEKPAPDVPTTARVDGPDADGKLDDTVKVTPAAADRLERELDTGQAELAKPLRQGNDSPATNVVPGPLAADETPGCRTRFVGNASSRGGARPTLIFLHQTVSRESGWASQDALTALAGRRSSGVSWHYAIGRSGGRCTYTVPLALKAWTQANANPWAVGIEVEARGDEGSYVVGAGKAKLLGVIRYAARRYGIPLRRGKVSPINCRPIRSGIVEHSDAGLCGGGHIDVTLGPSDEAAVIAAEARIGTAAPEAKPNTATEKRRCGALAHHRRTVRVRAGEWSDVLHVDGKRTTRGRRSGYLRRALERGHVDTRRYCQ